MNWGMVRRMWPQIVVAAHGSVTAAGAGRLGVGVDVVSSRFDSFDGVVDALQYRWGASFEIEVETVDSNGTFVGTLWELKTNVAIALLEAGLGLLLVLIGYPILTFKVEEAENMEESCT